MEIDKIWSPIVQRVIYPKTKKNKVSDTDDVTDENLRVAGDAK